MTDYKLVPIPPTPEMVEAAEDAYMPFGDMDLAIRMAILVAPEVQGEPVAYLRKDQLRQVQRKGTMLGDIADNPRADRVPVYAAPDLAMFVGGGE